MRKREKEALEARANRLYLAVLGASERLRHVKTPLGVCIMTNVQVAFGFGRLDESGTAFGTYLLASDEETYPSLRVGKNPGDKFFELKLVPLDESIVVPFLGSDADSPQLFVRAQPEDLVRIYTGREIAQLIKLLHSL